MATKNVHVIAKSDTTDHVVKGAAPLPPLQDGHVRARTILIGLSSNNMGYATSGARFHWWDTFPVPADLPAPYNDQSLYGVVPCWGYAEVLESKIQDINVGRLIWGFWPSSELPVDLKLTPTVVEGHYIERSEHRKEVMNLYQRYILAEANLSVDSLKDEKIFEKLCYGTLAVWEGGYLLNKAVFGPPAVHPLGAGQWSSEAADLSGAVVISLSGSGRTARSFTDNVFHERQAGTRPLAFLAITSNANANVFRNPPIPTQIVPYKDMTSDGTFAWISKHKPSKIVVVDFGGRDNAFDTLFPALQKGFPEASVMAIGVGAEAKSHDAEYVTKFAARNEIADRTMMNTTGMRDAMMEALGEVEYFRGQEKAWQDFIDRDCVGDMAIDVGRGIAGDSGFERGWADLCVGKLPGDKMKVYLL